MSQKNDPKGKFADLRNRAQSFLAQNPDKTSTMSMEDIQDMVHELDTYQIELELQNEDLRQVQAQLDKSRKRFSDLFDFAPVGYFTISKKGLIVECNLTAADMIGEERGYLLKQPFTRYIVKYDQDIYYRHRATLLESQKQQSCELRMKNKEGRVFPVQLESAISNEVEGDFPESRVCITDISERKQNEEERKSIEERLRDIFIFMKGGGGVYKAVDEGKDFIIVDFCRPDHRDLKITHENLVGQSILDVFPANRGYGLFQVIKRVWETGIPEHHPVTIVDGEEVRGWRENYVYRLSSGEVVALYEDITERKQMEMAIEDSENLFRTIFETSPDPININRLKDGKFIVTNKGFLEFTGYDQSEVIGKTALDIEVWNDLAERNKFFDHLNKKGKVKGFEAQFRCKNGTILTAQVSATKLDYNDEPHLLAVSRDITQLKNTEKALLKAHKELEERYEVTSDKLTASEIKYSTLVEALLTGVYICLNDELVFVNNQLAEIFNYDKNELLNTNIQELIFPQDRESINEILTRTLNSIKDESDFEIRGVRKNGEIIYLLGKNTVIDFAGKKAILGNITNISERKQAEKALQKSEQELKILSAQLLSAEEKERKRIAGDIHDSIGQALSAIKFSVENSINYLTEESFQSAGDVLAKIVPLTQQTIEEVRRIVMDLRPSILDDLGLKATISWFCREFESIYSDIRIQQTMHFEESDIVAPLKTVIYRIVQEAINNSAKHSKTDCILLSIEMINGNLELLVEDKGGGFDVNMVVPGVYQQRGMGLAIMRERAVLSGGTFEIESSMGEGTRVYVSWPEK